MPAESASSLPPLSQRFLEFAGPDLPPKDDEGAFMAAVRVFGMGWNRGVFADESHNAREFDRHIEALPASARVPLQSLYRELIARKRRMFPNDTRIIADSRLKRSGYVVSLEIIHGDASRIGNLSIPRRR